MNPLLSLAAAIPFLASSPSSIDAMRWQRRVLVVAAPMAGDHALIEQRRILAAWRQAAADRDITVVEVIGNDVTGASDPADTLRRRYRLPARAFSIVLVGKDGHVAMRDDAPIAANRLGATIDAMPMRRAGQR